MTLIEKLRKYLLYHQVNFGEEILPSNQQQIIQQAKFNYSPLGKAIEKQIKTIKVQGEKQVKAIQDKQIVNINKDDNKDKL